MGLKCKAVSDSPEEAGGCLVAFTRLDLAQWKAAWTTNVTKRGVSPKDQDPDRAALHRDPAYAALGSPGPWPDHPMRKIDGWQTLLEPIQPMPLDLTA